MRSCTLVTSPTPPWMMLSAPNGNLIPASMLFEFEHFSSDSGLPATAVDRGEALAREACVGDEAKRSV